MTVTTEDLNSMYGTLMGFLADAGTRHFDATDAEPSLIELLIVGMFNDGLKTTRCLLYTSDAADDSTEV